MKPGCHIGTVLSWTGWPFVEWQRGAGDLGRAVELISAWKASGGACMDRLVGLTEIRKMS